jgi:hypothetical protein
MYLEHVLVEDGPPGLESVQERLYFAGATMQRAIHVRGYTVISVTFRAQQTTTLLRVVGLQGWISLRGTLQKTKTGTTNRYPSNRKALIDSQVLPDCPRRRYQRF